MPSAPRRPCPPPGCPNLVTKGLCSVHLKAARKRTDAARPSSAKRGYAGAAWQALRLQVLRRDPICVDCKRAPSTVADHTIPKRFGGEDTLANLSGKCASCHNARTARELGWGRRDVPGRSG